MADINVTRLLERKPTSKRHRVNTKTASYTILPKQTGETFTNTGATGAVTFTLPAGRRIGDHFRFFVNAEQELRIDPGDASDSIVDVSLAPDAGEYITANGLGEHISVEYIGGNKWFAYDKAGTWTEETP